MAFPDQSVSDVVEQLMFLLGSSPPAWWAGSYLPFTSGSKQALCSAFAANFDKKCFGL